MDDRLKTIFRYLNRPGMRFAGGMIASVMVAMLGVLGSQPGLLFLAALGLFIPIAVLNYGIHLLRDSLKTEFPDRVRFALEYMLQATDRVIRNGASTEILQLAIMLPKKDTWEVHVHYQMANRGGIQNVPIARTRAWMAYADAQERRIFPLTNDLKALIPTEAHQNAFRSVFTALVCPIYLSRNSNPILVGALVVYSEAHPEDSILCQDSQRVLNDAVSITAEMVKLLCYDCVCA